MVVLKSAMASPYIFDLVDALRNDPVHGAAIRKAAAALASIERGRTLGKATISDVSKAQAELVAASGMNFGLLIPYLIPKFGRHNAPMSFLDRPFMFAMTCLAPNTTVTLRAGRQVGKCADGDTVIKTESGDITLRELFDRGVRTEV